MCLEKCLPQSDWCWVLCDIYVHLSGLGLVNQHRRAYWRRLWDFLLDDSKREVLSWLWSSLWSEWLSFKTLLEDTSLNSLICFFHLSLRSLISAVDCYMHMLTCYTLTCKKKKKIWYPGTKLLLTECSPWNSFSLFFFLCFYFRHFWYLCFIT